MELRHLRTFSMAAEQQSFTRAAAALSLTQAAVSQHVAALEKELSVSLFDRTGRAVVPTAAGHRLYEYARKILNLVEAAKDEVAHAAVAVCGSVKIAASSVPAETLLPELLLRFRTEYPDVHEAVTVSDSTQATDAVKTGEADVGFVGELPRDSRLATRVVGADELVLIVSPAHRFADKKKIKVKELKEEPLIVREPGSGSRRCVEQALEEAGQPLGDLKIVMETNSNDAIRGAVERGIGAAFVSLPVVARDIAEGRLVAVEIAGLQLRRRLYLISDPGRIPAAAARAFLAFFEQAEAGTADKTRDVKSNDRS
jgi:DNA-binding transcriptional LysR family regulator